MNDQTTHDHRAADDIAYNPFLTRHCSKPASFMHVRSYIKTGMIVLMCFAVSGCQTAPAPRQELTEAQQIELFKYGPVEKSSYEKAFDWPEFFKAAGLVIILIPLCLIPHGTVVDRSS